jgi:hypothetical protein
VAPFATTSSWNAHDRLGAVQPLASIVTVSTASKSGVSTPWALRGNALA